MDHFKIMEELGQISIFDLEKEKGLVHREPELNEGIKNRVLTSRSNEKGYIQPRFERIRC